MDISAVANKIQTWLSDQVRESGARGLVFGLSGGIDSAVVAGLCKRAVGNLCLGLIMPCHSDPRDSEDALIVASALGIPVESVDLGSVYDLHLSGLSAKFSSLGADPSPGALNMAVANLKPRLRMTTLYFFANALNYMVVGTGNRSEITVGYFTKHGDGGVDLLPIAGLVKSEVRELASYLRVPQRVIDKPPSAGLWQGQTDEGEMGMTYKDLDTYILTGRASQDVTERVERLKRGAQHKQRLPVSPDID